MGAGWEVEDNISVSGSSTPVHTVNTNYRNQWKSVAEIRNFIGKSTSSRYTLPLVLSISWIDQPLGAKQLTNQAEEVQLFG